MPQKPSRARRSARGAKPAAQDRQRSKSSATGKPGPVLVQSSPPYAVCLVSNAPEGCEVKIMGHRPANDVIVGPDAKAALTAAGALLVRFREEALAFLAAHKKPESVSRRPATLRLRPGRFYADRTGAVWCCYRIDPNVAPNVQGLCVEVETDTVMGFYLDGRWDLTGQSPRTLVEERVAP